MLLKSEKILSYDKLHLIDKSDEEILEIVKKLVYNIADQMLSEGYIKIEVLLDQIGDFGRYTKVRASTRVYNPDD